MVTDPCQVSPFPTTFWYSLFLCEICLLKEYIFHCWKEVPFSPYYSLSLSLNSCTSLPGACLDMGNGYCNRCESQRSRQVNVAVKSRALFMPADRLTGGRMGWTKSVASFDQKRHRIFQCLIHNTTEYIHFITLYCIAIFWTVVDDKKSWC